MIRHPQRTKSGLRDLINHGTAHVWDRIHVAQDSFDHAFHMNMSVVTLDSASRALTFVLLVPFELWIMCSAPFLWLLFTPSVYPNDFTKRIETNIKTEIVFRALSIFPFFFLLFRFLLLF